MSHNAKHNPHAAIIEAYLCGARAEPVTRVVRRKARVIGVRYVKGAPSAASVASVSGLYSAPGTTINYCGPTALAALTGHSVTACEDATLAHRKLVKAPRDHKGSARVKTMWGSEIEPVATRLGFDATLTFRPSFQHQRKSLATFLKGRADTATPLLILITGHYIAVRGDMFVDSANRAPTPLSKCKYMRCKVVRAWSVAPR